MNTELFKKVHKSITLEEGLKFNMGSWESFTPEGQEPSECGTTRCVAGWAVYETIGVPLFNGKGSWSDEYLNLEMHYGAHSIVNVACKLLDIDLEVGNQLFYADEDVAEQFVKFAAEGDEEMAMYVLNDYVAQWDY